MKENVHSLSFRNPDVVYLERTYSLSGKYMIFFGVHYEAGVPCWVVGSSNKETGEILMRHYNEKIPGCLAPQASATTYWEEFKHRMTENVHGFEEEPSYLEELQQHLN